MTKPDILAAVYSLLAKSVVRDKITADELRSKMRVDEKIIPYLALDSLEVADFSLRLESEFSIEINDEELESLRTVREIVSFIEARRMPSTGVKI